MHLTWTGLPHSLTSIITAAMVGGGCWGDLSSDQAPLRTDVSSCIRCSPCHKTHHSAACNKRSLYGSRAGIASSADPANVDQHITKLEANMGRQNCKIVQQSHRKPIWNAKVDKLSKTPGGQYGRPQLVTRCNKNSLRPICDAKVAKQLKKKPPEANMERQSCHIV